MRKRFTFDQLSQFMILALGSVLLITVQLLQVTYVSLNKAEGLRVVAETIERQFGAGGRLLFLLLVVYF